jgi:hypothetical protein
LTYLGSSPRAPSSFAGRSAVEDKAQAGRAQVAMQFVRAVTFR